MAIDNERISRVKAAMAKAGLDALVCRLPENVVMLSGYWPLAGRTFLVFPQKGTPLSIVPSVHEAEANETLWQGPCVAIPFGRLTSGDSEKATGHALKDALAACGAKRVGYEGSFETMAPPWNAAEPAIPAGPTLAMIKECLPEGVLVDVTEMLLSLRAVKTAQELEKLRTVNEISAMGLHAFAKGIRRGVTGVELAALVEQAVMVQGTGYRGAKCVRGFAQVSTGLDETLQGYRMILISTTRPMATGDMAMLELAVVADGFWSDRTRTGVLGPASAIQARAYDAVVRAQQAAIGALKPGVAAHTVDAAARAVIEQAGFGEGFFHSTGHGLGFRYHEPNPIIEPGVETILEAGMVVTIEPGIYLPELGGIRMEDDFVITPGGCELLGPSNQEFMTEASQ